MSLRPALLDEGQVAVEGVEPAAGGAELVAVLVVVALEPAGADAEDEPPTPSAPDVVDGARHVGQQLGVAVAVARDEGADLDALGGLGPRGERRPALEVRAVGVAVERVEVVPGEEDVDADLLELGAGAPDVRVGRVLGLDLGPDADRVAPAAHGG